MNDTKTVGPIETWINQNNLSANQFHDPTARVISVEHLRPFAAEQDAIRAELVAALEAVDDFTVYLNGTARAFELTRAALEKAR